MNFKSMFSQIIMILKSPQIQVIVFLIGILFLILGFYLLWKIKSKKFKSFYSFLVFVCWFIGIINITSTSFYTVDEGDIVIITQFKKIFKTINSPGLNIRLPWMNVWIFPKRVVSYDIKDLKAQTQDGISILVDITMQIRVDPLSVTNVYKEIAKSYPSLASNIIIPNVREIIRDAFSEYTATQIYSERVLVSEKIKIIGKERFKSFYLIFQDSQLRKTDFPEEVDQAIQMKFNKQQLAESIVFDKQRAFEEAEIRIINAKAISNEQNIITSTITTPYLQYKAIEAYKELSKTSNSTFVIMPMDSKGTGVPLILDTQKK